MLKYNLKDLTKAYENGIVNKAYEGSKLVYQRLKEKEPEPKNYLRFKALGDCVFDFYKQDGEVLYYSLDSGDTWVELTEPTPTIHDGEYIYWKGAMNDIAQDIETRFPSSGRFNVEGNIMSLLYGDDFEGKTSLEGRVYTFFRLFGNTSVVDASSLVLPATTLGQDCYTGMFNNCTSLTVAPELPATVMTRRCYVGMFQGCTSLTTAPELPSTTLADQCYSYMFYGCTSLTVAPELPATVMTRRCYVGMFQGCTSLTTAPELPSTTLADQCYSYMFYGCTSLTTAPELPATTLVGACYLNMFQGCTSLTTAPELLATRLIKEMWGCYTNMFRDCSNLNYVKCLATENSDGDSYIHGNESFDWLDGVAAEGTFVKKAGVEWSSGDDGIPEGWTVEEE